MRPLRVGEEVGDIVKGTLCVDAILMLAHRVAPTMLADFDHLVRSRAKRLELRLIGPLSASDEAKAGIRARKERSRLL